MRDKESVDDIFFGDNDNNSFNDDSFNSNSFNSEPQESKRKYDSTDGERKLQHETANLKCPDCGSNYVYNAESRTMKCINCGGEEEIDADFSFDANEFDPDLDVRVTWNQETRVFKCSNCGAQTVFDNTEFASECAFCGSPNIITLNDFDGIKPDIVMPFSLATERIVEILKRWVKRKFFAPTKFKREFKENRHPLNGVYCPCWLFDAKTQSSYTARAGTYYYVTVGSGKNRRTIRKTRWRRVSGKYAGDFNNIFIECSPHLNQKTIDKLKPFPMNQFVSYDKRYLLGFKADHYDSGLNESWQSAKAIIDRNIERGVKGQIRADVVENLVVRTKYYDKQYKYGLVPVYLGSYKHKSKEYKFYVNGATGKLYGKTPVSGLKVTLFVLAIVGGLLLLNWILNLAGISPTDAIPDMENWANDYLINFVK